MTTLYLTEPRSVVRKDGDTLLVQIPADQKQGRERRQVRVPLIKITQVIVYGDVTLTSPALAALLEQKTDVCFCSTMGKFYGHLTPVLGKNCQARMEQHRAHNDPIRRLALAQAFVLGKIANMRTMLQRANRKRDEDAVTASVDSLKGIMQQVQNLNPGLATAPADPSRPQAGTLMGTLQGLEGAATAAYFSVFPALLNDDWGFRRRQRRPPRDPLNSLLSFGYALLTNKVSSAVSIVGMDPFVGFLHSSQFGKPALALDVMEAFRPIIVDSVVITVLNTKMLGQSDFREEFGAWRLTEAGRRTFLTKFEERLNTEIQHPVFRYKASYRRCLELEVRLVSKRLTREIDSFQAFVVR